MSVSSEGQTASSTERSDGGLVRTAFPPILRIVSFFGFWLTLTDAAPGDLAAGVVAAVAAAWASLRLLPRGVATKVRKVDAFARRLSRGRATPSPSATNGTGPAG
jgi:hypothetical protein